MKFLILTKPLPGAPRQENPVAVLQAGKEWIDARLADGSLDCAYNVIGPKQGMSGVAIANADSHEALTELVLSFPAYAFCDLEILPLSDLDHFLGKAIEITQKSMGG